MKNINLRITKPQIVKGSNRTLKTFELPEEIKNKGADTIARFRSWFKENEYLLEDPAAFVMRLQMAWNISLNPKAINVENSGFQEFKNYTVKELEEKIDKLLRDAAAFFKASKKNETILRKFAKASSKAYMGYPIENNTTIFSNEEINAFLKSYHETYKLPVRKLLVEYYRVKLNPKLEFAENLLEALGFKACVHCHGIVFTL